MAVLWCAQSSLAVAKDPLEMSCEVIGYHGAKIHWKCGGVMRAPLLESPRLQLRPGGNDENHWQAGIH